MTVFDPDVYERDSVTIAGTTGVFVRPKSGGLPAIAAAVPRPERAPSPFGFDYRSGVETIWIKGKKSGHPRMIHGVASTPTVNTHNYSLSPAGCEIRFPIPILSKHDNFGSIGEITLVRKCAQQIFVRGIIHNTPAGDHAWRLIESGELRCFSGAAVDASLVPDGSVEGVRYFKRWRLREITVCKVGANPDCTFEIFRG